MSITLTLDKLFKMLANAAEEGINVGNRGTSGDYTASGIAFNAYMDYENAQIADVTATPALSDDLDQYRETAISNLVTAARLVQTRYGYKSPDELMYAIAAVTDALDSLDSIS